MASHSRTKSIKIPSLRRCNGRGFVELNGRRVPVAPHEITVVEVAVAYFEHANRYYRRPDGTLTTSIDAVIEAIRATRLSRNKYEYSGGRTRFLYLPNCSIRFGLLTSK